MVKAKIQKRYLMSSTKNTDYDTYKVLMSPRSEIDIQRIYEYIFVKFLSKESAIKIKNKILEKILSLNYMPLRFKECLKNNGIRSVKVSSYVIIYTVNEKAKEVYVQRIAYCRVDFEKLFSECDA